MNLTVADARRLGSKELHLVDAEHRQDSYREEHDTQTSEPLCKTTPQEQRMRLAFNVVEDRGTCGGKTRHRLEKSICKTRDRPPEPIRQATKKRKCNPTGRDSNIAVAARELAIASFANDVAPYPGKHSSQCGDEESEKVIPLQKRRRYTEEKKDTRKQQQQRAYDAKYSSKMNQIVL